jgi:hypothetical protein
MQSTYGLLPVHIAVSGNAALGGFTQLCLLASNFSFAQLQRFLFPLLFIDIKLPVLPGIQRESVVTENHVRVGYRALHPLHQGRRCLGSRIEIFFPL